MWREKNIYFTEHDIYFTKLMFILKNINLELKSALRTKYIFYRILLYLVTKPRYFLKPSYHTLELALISLKQQLLDMQITDLAIPGFMACHRDRLNWY